MCGIAGRVNFRSGAPVDAAVLQNMCTLIAHRGPDADGIYANGAVGLGHRRLSIIDLSDAGRQPMSTPDGRFWVTFNGEIYNFLELRGELEQDGYRFHSHSDTEVILAAYRRYGIDCLNRFRGMFAFAIWDAQERSLLLARDRIGKKPLYYRFDGDGLSFASEPKAFLAEESFQATPNDEALWYYLTYQYVPAPLSAFASVSRLRPGHYLLLKDGEWKTERYWKLRYTPKRQLSDDDACDALLEELRTATRLRMISDVPLGAFLSGGVDSSAVVALMSEFSSGPVKTFSIGFDEKRFDELEYARAIATKFQTDHHEFVVRPNAVEIFDKLVWHYNEPFADSSAIPTYYLAQMTRQHVTVALNGDAGDENFAGYGRYAQGGLTARYQKLPFAARRALAAALGPIPSRPGGAGVWPRARQMVMRGAMSPERRYSLSMMQFDGALLRRLCTPEFAARAGVADAGALLVDEMTASDAPDLVDEMLAADVNWYLPDALLVKVDIATMAHGLEGRSPLLDHRVMELAASLPSTMKRRNGESKYIFKRALRRLLPDDILDRPKQGFAVPLEHWFRNELRDLAYETLLGPRAVARGYFRPAAVRRLLDEHVRGVRKWNEQLWNLLMLELWHRRFIDERPRRHEGRVVAEARSLAKVG